MHLVILTIVWIGETVPVMDKHVVVQLNPKT